MADSDYSPLAVVVGHLYDGFEVVGPFHDPDKAWAFAEGGDIPPEWVTFVVELKPEGEWQPPPDFTGGVTKPA